MIIDVNRVSPEGSEYTGEEPASVLDVGPEQEVQFRGPLRYKLKAIVVSLELIVNGELALDASFRCSRCGEMFPHRVREPAFECVREILHMNESVDLTPDIRESMLLALPSYPVCSPDCRGLCSHCGVNLNKSSCTCKAHEVTGWEALKGLETRN
jgi:uncharacterized protein